ncbi:SlyX family protein [Stappia taiwanensis]|uniref:SlyX family protein n=1 Tax=Stappia taiwanensis TaxID=992267 RepID=A0A838XQI0_9HYPH|nr:SlyX family protein [Stappia taiwanensis]MBA4612047.1 SlyX family protein [Stappia taiwanensis]GGE91488.1 protein SlyX [Stappia taiwanensis]
MTRDTVERIERLEEQAAHQERTIEDLNEVITAQARQLDALARKVAALAEHVDELEDLSVSQAPVTRPPHY